MYRPNLCLFGVSKCYCVIMLKFYSLTFYYYSQQYISIKMWPHCNMYIHLSSIVLVSYVSDIIRSADCHRKSSHGTQFTLQYYQTHTHFIHQLYTFELVVSTVMNNKYINLHSKFCKGPKNKREYTHTMSKFCIMKESSLLLR
jgi:hypothetical protein